MWSVRSSLSMMRRPVGDHSRGNVVLVHQGRVFEKAYPRGRKIDHQDHLRAPQEGAGRVPQGDSDFHQYGRQTQDRNGQG